MNESNERNSGLVFFLKIMVVLLCAGGLAMLVTLVLNVLSTLLPSGSEVVVQSLPPLSESPTQVFGIPAANPDGEENGFCPAPQAVDSSPAQWVEEELSCILRFYEDAIELCKGMNCTECCDFQQKIRRVEVSLVSTLEEKCDDRFYCQCVDTCQGRGGFPPMGECISFPRYIIVWDADKSLLLGLPLQSASHLPPLGPQDPAYKCFQRYLNWPERPVYGLVNLHALGSLLECLKHKDVDGFGPIKRKKSLPVMMNDASLLDRY